MARPQVKQPRTTAEWQEAADLAHGSLCLESARMYGLIRGGPGVNVARCRRVLAKAQRRRIEPRPDALDRFIEELVAAGFVIRSVKPGGQTA